MYKRFIIAFLLNALLVASVHATELEFFDQSFGDYSEELEIAKDEKKEAILIFFELEDCPFCDRMKTTILNKPEVVSFYKKHFKIFPMDVESKVEMTDFQGRLTTYKTFANKQNRVRATPVFAFFSLEGKRIVRYTGATSTMEEFLLLGKYTLDKEYKKTSFTRYKRELKKSRTKSSE